VHIKSSPRQAPHRSRDSAAATLTLAPETDSVPRARRFVVETLTQIDAPGACDDAVALVSELATNAVIHARTPYTIVVSSSEGDTIRVGVHDFSAVIPRRRGYGLDATTGRGLRLVATIASTWGIEAQPDGKVVWFEVRREGSRDVPSWYADVDLDALLDAFDDGSPVDARSRLGQR
jgi:anti-sigma regulatory factor (Ser/Thr protein kinase)